MGSHFGLTLGQPTVVSSSENLQELSQIIAKPDRGQCSSWKEDCFSTGCCDIVGYTCYQTKPSAAKCMKNCTASASQQLHPAPVHHGTSVAGRINSGDVFVLLLGVHEGHWHDQKDRRVGDHSVSVLEGTQHLRLRAAGRVRRRASGGWARPSDHQGGGRRERLAFRQA